MTAINVLQGKCALITGSTQGLGLAAAKRFAAAGCNVVIHGLGDEREMDALRADIEKQYGVRTMYCGENLTQTLEIERMIGTILDAFGVIDILVNNAVSRYAAPVEQFPAGEWDLAIAVNLSAAFHTIRLALPAMRKRNWGRIINVSSIYGLKATTNRISYVTTKTALIGMTRAVALETRDQDITCNAVCPGTVETPLNVQVLERSSDPAALRAGWERMHPIGRLGQPIDIAYGALYLACDESSWLTGQCLTIDGGMTTSALL